MLPSTARRFFLPGRKSVSAVPQGRRSRTGVLPNFFIGAHAQVTGLPILTRDPRPYRTYFPEVEVIAPEM